MRLRRREKVFGPGPRIPLDRNAKARVMAYAKAWNARHRQPGQHRGPLTRATVEVLEALLWGFHNAASGACFPSYEAIAAKAECCRDTVYEAIKALELAGVLTWVNRIVRERVRERDLFGQWGPAGGCCGPRTPTRSGIRRRRKTGRFLLSRKFHLEPLFKDFLSLKSPPRPACRRRWGHLLGPWRPYGRPWRLAERSR